MLNTNQGSATCCIQVPILESRLPTQNVPKRFVNNKESECEVDLEPSFAFAMSR